MKKKISVRRGKKLYLLGKGTDGTYYWLVEPSWDCDWYWGFGYVQTFTNNTRPDLARDLESHLHIDSCFMGKIGENGEYIYNIFDAPRLKGGTTFTEKEGWELSELFSQFYTLRKSSDLFHSRKSNVSSTSVKHDNETCGEIYDYINNEMMPAIFARIKEILAPKKEG